ncbi:MAG: flagellar M-ring protein FliF [Calditrichaeota bacterium]|nr:flagellar M-ring protein FliF [Calditrichota bacterium]
MGNQLRVLYSQVKETFLKFDKSKRFVIVGTAFGTLILLTLVVLFSSRKDYQVLFSQLDPQEAGTIVEKLKADKVPFKLESGGTTILVPRNKVYEERISLANQGLPAQGGIGYEIFDKNNIGATDFVQRVNYQRALEGELARTISSLNEVKRARVHLVLPNESLFVEDQKPATASVTLQLRPGTKLKDQQVQGIANLVSSSVEGLQPDHITIVDSNGNILSHILEKDDTLGLTSSQIALQEKVESYYSRKVQSLLEQAVGSGNAIVRVAADLDFNKVQKTFEKYSPDTTVLRSEETNYQISPGDTVAGTGGKVENHIRNYEINKTVQQVVQGVGTIRRLSVAVMVDGKYVTKKGKDGKLIQQYEPRSAEEMQKLTRVVKSAIGFSTKRHDDINVVNVAFDRSFLQKEQAAFARAEKQAFWAGIIRKGLYGLSFLFVLFGLMKIIRSFKTEIRPLRNTELPFGGEELVQEIPIETQKKIQIQQKVANLTSENPDGAAKLLKAWLVDEVEEENA